MALTRHERGLPCPWLSLCDMRPLTLGEERVLRDWALKCDGREMRPEDRVIGTWYYARLTTVQVAAYSVVAVDQEFIDWVGDDGLVHRGRRRGPSAELEVLALLGQWFERESDAWHYLATRIDAATAQSMMMVDSCRAHAVETAAHERRSRVMDTYQRESEV